MNGIGNVQNYCSNNKVSIVTSGVGEGITPDSYGLNMMHFIPQGGAITKNMQLLKEWIGY